MPAEARASSVGGDFATGALASLLSRRLLIVTGKGGTGKTSVASALAIAAARRGQKTLVVETTDEPQCAALLGRADAAASGREPIAIDAGLSVLHLDPLEALTEYLELQLPVKIGVSRLIHSSGFRRLLDAAPGWRELITLGKLWYLESRGDWDLLVVDAPSTGHGLSFLSIPGVVMETVRLGPLRRHTEWVQALLRDSDRTLVVPVALPEELPVSETLELRARVAALELGLGPTIANAVEPKPALDGPAVLRALEGLPPGVSAPLPPPAEIREIVGDTLERTSLQARAVERLRGAGNGVVELPLIERGVQDRVGAELLADALEHAWERA